MFILLETIDYQQEHRDYYVIAECIEDALDEVNTISACCFKIDKAYLVENSKWFILPVDIFDGHSFSGPMAKLKTEWTELLITANE